MAIIMILESFINSTFSMWAWIDALSQATYIVRFAILKTISMQSKLILRNQTTS